MPDLFVMPLSATVEASLQQAAAQLPATTLRKLFHVAGTQIGSHDAATLDLGDLLPLPASAGQARALKEAYAATCILVADMAKQNLSKDNNSRWLLELGFQKNVVEDICGILSETIPVVQSLASVSGLRLDRVVDVSWRLDYCIRSSTFGTIHEPLYFVVLTVQEALTGSLTYERFTCSVAQLEELVFKLQEAMDQIDMVLRALKDDNKL
ncbi:hypothetical protein SDRG_05588 [Saprolegnia diclina VS20]|uniref:COMM domain-containing protein 3 n=1 Tax=Saprolegnia diclina (strain VS20) TaxID=1156394 RepID=T0QRM0_SAPDV|nr:hypothetical protein SDRG_05588 [Saprolegnia diclina VS20]EQC37371.1 hypothetical protein SDRG_05588 [Saprolegnia diclina VS20]|eukprot:XP_008609533.1 hypothetical protein SDRG_05588 [Saprolegnia diclina VS20]